MVDKYKQLIHDLDRHYGEQLSDWEIEFINSVEIRLSKNIMPSPKQINVLRDMQTRLSLEWKQ